MLLARPNHGFRRQLVSFRLASNQFQRPLVALRHACIEFGRSFVAFRTRAITNHAESAAAHVLSSEAPLFRLTANSHTIAQTRWRFIEHVRPTTPSLRPAAHHLSTRATVFSPERPTNTRQERTVAMLKGMAALTPKIVIEPPPPLLK